MTLEFFGSALAMADPLPVEGNAIEVLQNGDEFFPAMLEAIRSARKPSISRLTLFIRMKLDAPFAKH
jgi:Phosphatidylserine/phosphatidylglycerophosphate/cardiolipin synthases and related enzymes